MRDSFKLAEGIKCSGCGLDHLFFGYWKQRIFYSCNECGKKWSESASDSRKIKAVTLMKPDMVTNCAYATFYGIWTKPEIALIQDKMQNWIEDTSHGDWSFFKGHILTCWETSTFGEKVLRKMIIADDLQTLLTKFQDYCEWSIRS